jgi:hypothetical protein
MLKHIYLHVGPPKTGSTALQDALFNSADLLSAAGVYVPRQNNMTCILQPVRDRLVQRSDPQEYDRLVEVITTGGRSEHLGRSFTKVVVSCEFLSGLNVDALEKIRAILHGGRHRVHAVMYLRDPASLQRSRVQEQLKKGIPYRQTAGKIVHRNKALFERLSGVFGDALIVREFKGRASGWGILDDFESVCALPKLVQPTQTNTSMSLQAAMILDALSDDTIPASKLRDIVKQVLTIPGDPFTLGREEYETCLDALAQDADWANRTFHTSFDMQAVPAISWTQERARILMRPDLRTLLEQIRSDLR